MPGGNVREVNEKKKGPKRKRSGQERLLELGQNRRGVLGARIVLPFRQAVWGGLAACLQWSEGGEVGGEGVLKGGSTAWKLTESRQSKKNRQKKKTFVRGWVLKCRKEANTTTGDRVKTPM